MDIEELSTQAMLIVKAEVKHRITVFGETPAGQVIRAAGREVIAARSEGREISAKEVADFFFNLGAVFDGNESKADSSKPDK